MNKRIKIISIILIIIISIIIVPKEFQNDTFYLIRVGESLLNNGIDFVDHFSFHNLPYLYPHLLFSIIVYTVYNLFSFTGLHILTILFTIILGFCIYYVNIKNSKNNIISLTMTIVFLITMLGFVTLRAQILSYSIFILEYYFLNKLINTNKTKYIFYIFILSILLVNTHVAVYPFYIILFLPFIGEFILNKILKKDNIKIKKLLIALILVLSSGLISPLFLNSYTYLYNTLINNTTNYISEHQPPILIKDIRLIFLILTIIFMFVTNKFKLKLSEKLLLLGTLFMTFISKRHECLLIIFTVIIFNKYWGNYLLQKESKEVIKVEKLIVSKKGLLFLLLYVILITFIIYVRPDNKKEYINAEIYPVEAVEYIKNNLDYKNIKIFNNYNTGSYLILNDIKVFIDSRSDLYTKSYNKKQDIFNDYVNVMNINVHYEEIFYKYNINYVLLEKNHKISILLNKDNNYKLEYNDNYYNLYKRINNNIK